MRCSSYFRSEPTELAGILGTKDEPKIGVKGGGCLRKCISRRIHFHYFDT